MSSPGVLPSAAVFIGRETFTIKPAGAGANVLVQQQVSGNNPGPDNVQLAIYCVLNDNPNLVDSYLKVIVPNISSREETSSMLYNLAAGDYKFDLYALSSGPCTMGIVTILPLILYA